MSNTYFVFLNQQSFHWSVSSKFSCKNNFCLRVQYRKKIRQYKIKLRAQGIMMTCDDFVRELQRTHANACNNDANEIRNESSNHKRFSWQWKTKNMFHYKQMLTGSAIYLPGPCSSWFIRFHTCNNGAGCWRRCNPKSNKRLLKVLSLRVMLWYLARKASIVLYGNPFQK